MAGQRFTGRRLGRVRENRACHRGVASGPRSIPCRRPGARRHGAGRGTRTPDLL